MSDPTSATQDRIIGRTLGDFVVQEKIGEGGFGAVYRAEQRLLKRDAVIKVLRQSHRSDQAIIQRFLREAQLASSLDHPYAAHIYAFGAEPDGLLWIAMERVRGTPLSEMLRAGPLPLERFVPLFQRICEVVQNAHERSIVHRDLKPSNVMVLARSGLFLPKLLDFGVAKTIDEPEAQLDPTELSSGEIATIADPPLDQKLTQAGALIGSPYYMAPEQWVNQGVGPPTDLYALGVLAYEALTGRVPFEGRNAMAIARAHATRPVPPLGHGLPVALDAVLARAMAKRPDQRFASALDLAAELHAASGLSAEPLGLPQLDEPVREAVLAGAPQPLAEAVAALDAVRSIHQARDAFWQIFHVAVRLLGLYAIAARSRGAIESDRGDQAAELLRTLHRRGLSDREWLALTSDLVAPHVARRDAYPLPELVSLFFDAEGAPVVPDPLGELAALREESESGAKEDEVRQHLGRVTPLLSSALRRMAFLNDYPLCVVRGEVTESWMGVRRPRRATVEPRGDKLEDGSVVLLAMDRTPVLLLRPLMFSGRPTPGATEELFLLEGPGRRGARLLSLPAALEHIDDSLWDWYRATLGAATDAAEHAASTERAPYIGLAAFGSDDVDLFFGRDHEVETTLNRLRTASFLAVVGPSGAGKSSFVHAGVSSSLPPGSKMIAMRPGAQPFHALAARLQRASPQSHLDAALLGASPDALAAALATLPAPPGAWNVLVVDQFEELFTLTADEGERARFAEAVVRAARGPEAPVRVIFTLRDDFLMRAQQLAALREPLAVGLQLLGTPAPDQLRRIVVEPARRLGYELDDPKLADDMVAAVRQLPAALPLLSFTALRLWELRDRHFHQLTRKAYESMGGVGGALARHAEEMLAQLGPEEHRLVRESFRHLVTAEGTRAVLTRVELAQVLAGGARAEAVIDRLIESRLVVAAEAERGETQIEIAHEALISAWPRLVTWRSEDAEGARLRDQLRAAVRQWSERGRPRGLLWRDEALAEYELWRARHPQPLTEAEEAFARGSVGQARAGKRLRRSLLIGAFAVLAVGLFVLFRSDQRSRVSAAEAKQRLATVQQEQGRQHLLDGNPLRALVYLGDAARLGLDELDLRLLIGQALQALEPQRLVLRGHTKEVWNAHFTKDGARILTFSPEGVAYLFDAHTGARQMKFEQPGMLDARISLDAKLVVTRNETTAQVWDANTGRALWSTDGLWQPSDQAAEPAPAQFSPDGRFLVTAGVDLTVRVWRAMDGAAVHILRGHTDHVHALEFAGPTRLITASADGTARVWDVATGKLLHAVGAAKSEALYFAAVSPDGKYVLTCGRAARLWDLRTAREVAVFPQTNRADGGAFSPDGSMIAVLGDLDTHVQLWDLQGRPLASLQTKNMSSWLEFSPDGQRLLTAGSDGITRVWDPRSGRPLLELVGHVGRVWHAHWSPDGNEIVSASTDRTARTWRPIAPGLELVLSHPRVTFDAQPNDDGTRILTSSEDGTLRAWDMKTGKLLSAMTPALPPSTNAMTFWASHGQAAVTFGGRRAWVWRPDGTRVAGPLEHERDVTWATLSNDGTRLAAGCDDGTIWMWRVADERHERTLTGHSKKIVYAILDAQGRRLASASEDGSARLWNLDGSAAPLVLAGHVGRVESIEFSADGSLVVTAGLDQTIRIWNAATGEPLAQLLGHTSDITMARFSNDGRLIASAGADGQRVWSVATGHLLYTRPRAAFALTFTPDGTHVLAGSDTEVTSSLLPGRDRPAAALLAALRCLLPFRLSGEAVLPAEIPSDCAN